MAARARAQMVGIGTLCFDLAPDLHFHDLRHTGLPNVVLADATITELMALAA